MTQKRIFWSQEDWLKLLVRAMPMAPNNEGKMLAKAVEKVQAKVLPKDRRRGWEAIGKSFRESPVARVCMDQLKAMTDEQRTRLLADQPPDVPKMQDWQRPTNPDGTRKLVMWKPHELALVAREVDLMQAEGDARHLWKLFVEAQQLVLPPERWRTRGSLEQAGYPSTKAYTLKAALEDGRKLIHELPPRDAPPEPTEEEVNAQAAADEPTPWDDADLEEPQSPPEPVALPTPQPAPVRSPERPLSALATDFANTLAVQFDRLLAAHMAQVMAGFEAKLAAASTTMGHAIAHQIQASLGQAVHATLEAELGGPIDHPKALEPEPPWEEPQEPPQEANGSEPHPMPTMGPRKRLQVDVVGLIGPQVATVKDAMRRYEDELDVRFFEADDLKHKTTQLREYVISTRWGRGQTLDDMVRRSGSKSIQAQGATNSVVQALVELREQHQAIRH